jgi:23S rRNA pseudouridine2605 synthase
MKHRIQKLLAAAGVDSRRHIEEMILQGRVAVNGVTKTRLPLMVDPERDDVTVDGEAIKLKGVLGREDEQGRLHKPARLFYLMLNKPRGVVSTNVAQGVQTRAIDLLPPNFPARVYPVGRLDGESRGLLLLTNDGELTNLLTHPRFGVPKTYRAVIDAFVLPEHMTMLEKGLFLIDRESGKGHKTGRAILKIQQRTRARTVIDITIKEGRNRQIRRMLARLGYKVKDLMRIKFGPLTLEGVPNGSVRPLTTAEVKELRSMAEKSKAFFEKQAEGEVDAKGGSGKVGKRKVTTVKWKAVSERGGERESGRVGRPKPGPELDFVPDDEIGDD